MFAATLPLPANQYFSDAFRLAIANNRPAIIALVLLGSTWLGIRRRGRRLAIFLRHPLQGRLLVLGLAFPAFFALTSLLKPEQRIATLGLYLLWPVFIFLCIPLLAQSSDEVRRLTRTVFAANILCWLVPFGLFHARGPVPSRFDEVISYGYSNPDYYAQILQVLFALVLLRVAGTQSRLGSFQWVSIRLLLLLTFVGAWQVSARNVIVFMVASICCFWLVRRTRRPLLVICTVLAVGMTIGIFALQHLETKHVDEMSSGRIDNWTKHTERVLQEDGGMRTVLFGPDKLPEFGVTAGYDALKRQKKYSKFHIDNVYLEFFFEAGLIGLLLFLIPYGLLVVRASRRIRAQQDSNGSITWAVSVLVGIGAQSALVSTIPTFGNPLAPLFAIAVLLACGNPPPRPRRALGRTPVTVGHRNLGTPRT